MNNCLCVRDFIEKMLRSGHSFLVVDLADCTGMDSTFMGVLAGAATFRDVGPQPGVAAVNCDEALTCLLDSVGISELVLVDAEPFQTPDVEFVRLKQVTAEPARLACIREAHMKLVALSEENEKTFGPLVAVLEREMKQKGML